MTLNSEFLRIAIQKSGRLRQDTETYLSEKFGINCTSQQSDIRYIDPVQKVEYLFMREKDIPQMVKDGFADMGIVGENTYKEAKCEDLNYQRLGFSKCRIALAYPNDQKDNYTSLNDFDGKTIATSYPNIIKQYMKLYNVDVDVRYMSGSVEIAPAIGCADAIFDVVETGRSLRENNLTEFSTVFESQAVAMFSPEFDEVSMNDMNIETMLAIKENMQKQPNQLLAERIENQSFACRTYS